MFHQITICLTPGVHSQCCQAPFANLISQVLRAHAFALHSRLLGISAMLLCWFRQSLRVTKGTFPSRHWQTEASVARSPSAGHQSRETMSQFHQKSRTLMEITSDPCEGGVLRAQTGADLYENDAARGSEKLHSSGAKIANESAINRLFSHTCKIHRLFSYSCAAHSSNLLRMKHLIINNHGWGGGW